MAKVFYMLESFDWSNNLKREVSYTFSKGVADAFLMQELDEAFVYNCTSQPEGVFALCEARHEMPSVEGSIFGNTINPLDVETLEEEALNKVIFYDHVTLYVTGLSVALVAVINACIKGRTKLTLMHYNRETNDYYPQEVNI